MPNDMIAFINAYVAPLGWKLAGVVAVWLIGSWGIRLLVKGLRKALQRRQIDQTLAKYAEGGVNIGLRVLLVVMLLGMLGIETTSFAALLAAAGVAIGAAWAGLLAHFAAGVFLVFLRPFKVGDVVMVGGVSGTVKEIGLFSTALDTADHVRVYIQNNTVFSGNILNYSTNPRRRVDLTAQLNHETNPMDAIQQIEEKLRQVPNVLAEPKPQVEILGFNEYGPLLAVRPFCTTGDYTQVYFDVNKAIVAVTREAGYLPPEQHTTVRSV